MRILSFIIIIYLFCGIAAAQSPHGDKFNIDCSNCHVASSWKVMPAELSFSHDETSFKLTGQHKTVECKNCHESLVFSEAKENCFSCHKDIHQGTVGFNCENCHSSVSWIVTDINSLHQNSRFPLVGIHLNADCIQCHTGFTNLTFEPIGVSCFDCHSKEFYSTIAPNHQLAGFSTECQECHSINSAEWAGVNFDHSFFPLTGGHNIQNCFSCHNQGNNFIGLSSECYSCHRTDYESVTDPNHLSANFSHDCTQCHNINNWISAAFNHNLTQFPLTGAHINVNCVSCHSQGYSGTSINCVSCHNQDYNSSVNPNHTAAGISTECQSCHTTTAWIPSNFNHTNIGYPLLGSHAQLECSSCHKGTTTGLNQLCISCHQQDYNTAEDHLAQNYPTTCEMCHNYNSWEDADFDHQSTAFPLTGAHTITDCQGCHQNGFSGTSAICSDCHQTNYNSSTNPSHTALAISTDCQSCHTTNPDWKPAAFSIHNDYYQLIGAHASLDCMSCHNGNYNQTANTCIGCHQQDYNNTANPPHSAAGFSTDCLSCHSQNAWQPAMFDHDNQYFPIYSGEHREKWNACSDCHTNPANFAVFSCINCHEHNQNEMDDKHTGISGYVYASEQCFSCHPRGDSEGAFNHSTSAFPLTGAHLSVSCIQCHQNGYANTSNQCISCHNQDYNSSINPDHTAAGISTECQTCHTSSVWIPSNFNHTNTGYPLLGSHAQLECSSCHKGTTTGLNQQCISCHQQDYNNTTNPPHSPSGFSTDCQSCHSQNAWQPATFDHDNQYFPIYSGEHRGEWNACSDCHTNPANFAVFSCINCHEHNQNEMDDKHNEINNYVYDSNACLSCHPKGEEGSNLRIRPGRFN